MNVETMKAGKELDLLLGRKAMKFTKAAYFKNGGGCYPEDATPINDEPGKCWSATSKGGTYPYLAGDSLFRGVKGGLGETWCPSTNIAQAFEVMEKIVETHCDFSLERSGAHQWTATFPGWSATARTPELAICLAALEAIS